MTFTSIDIAQIVAVDLLVMFFGILFVGKLIEISGAGPASQPMRYFREKYNPSEFLIKSQRQCMSLAVIGSIIFILISADFIFKFYAMKISAFNFAMNYPLMTSLLFNAVVLALIAVIYVILEDLETTSLPTENRFAVESSESEIAQRFRLTSNLK